MDHVLIAVAARGGGRRQATAATSPLSHLSILMQAA
jgi:hypothetical protein